MVLVFPSLLSEPIPRPARDLQGLPRDPAHLSEGAAQPEGCRHLQILVKRM